jgi:hypothetical protein
MIFGSLSSSSYGTKWTLAMNASMSANDSLWREVAAAFPAQNRYGFDCLNFLVASVGLGTFVAFYLADLGWSKESVGLALATGQIAGVPGQIPGGAITDAIFWKKGFARRRPQR